MHTFCSIIPIRSAHYTHRNILHPLGITPAVFLTSEGSRATKTKSSNCAHSRLPMSILAHIFYHLFGIILVVVFPFPAHDPTLLRRFCCNRNKKKRKIEICSVHLVHFCSIKIINFYRASCVDACRILFHLHFLQHTEQHRCVDVIFKIYTNTFDVRNVAREHESWTPKAMAKREKGAFYFAQTQNCCNTTHHRLLMWIRMKWTEYDVLWLTVIMDDDKCPWCMGARTYSVQSFHIMEIIIQAIYVSHVVIFSGSEKNKI